MFFAINFVLYSMEKIKQEHALSRTESEMLEIHNKGLSKIIDNSLDFFKNTVNQTMSLKIEEASEFI